MYAPAPEWNKKTGFARPSYPAVPADKSQPPLTLWTQDPASYRTDCCLGRRLTPERDPHWSNWVSMSYQCGKAISTEIATSAATAATAIATGGLCTGCEANKTKYEAPYKTRPPWHGLITEPPPADTVIFWQQPGGSIGYRNHPTKKTMPKWCPDGYKMSAPVASVASVAAASVATASVTASVAANEGQLKLIDGELRMVKNGNVYEYDETADTVGAFVGRLTAEGTIDVYAEEVEPEPEPEPKPASALSLLAAAMARAKQDAEELSALRASTTSTASLTATVAALRAENAALKAKLDTVKALFTA